MENASRVSGADPDIFGVSGPLNIVEKTVISSISHVPLVCTPCRAILIRPASEMEHHFGEYMKVHNGIADYVKLLAIYNSSNYTFNARCLTIFSEFSLHSH